MVQKKGPDKHGSPAEPKGGHATRPEKRLYSHQHQDGRGGGSGGGGGLKKMLSKSRSIKLLEESLDSPLGTQLVRPCVPPPQNKKKRRPSAVGLLPNYMRSTSSSDARKEQAQVSSSSFSSHSSRPTAAASNGVGRPGNSKRAEKPTSAGGASGLKRPTNLPARKPSSRAVMPPTKRIPDVPLCSSHMIRATCSSAMKETSFPDHLDLSPGATEADGTSVYKVCPYTYCSLNGHRHAPLPPLRSFLTARRRLLKSQRSIKLRGLLPSFGKTDPAEEATETAGAKQSVISSLVEDLGDDFFLEIYAVRPTGAPVSGGGSHDDAHPGAAGGVPSAADGGDGSVSQIGEDRRSQLEESSSQINSEDDVDQISQFSPSEMEVLINFLEFVECDPEDPPCQDSGDCWSCDDCALRDTDEWGSDLAEEEGACEPEEEDEGFYIDFDEIDYSEFAEYESSEGTIFPLPSDEEEADEIVADDEGRTGSEETVGADISTLEELLAGKNIVEPVSQETEEPDAGNNPEPIGDPNEEPAPDDEAEDTFGIDKLFPDTNARAVDNTERKHEKTQRARSGEPSFIEMETWESDEEGEEPPGFEEGPDENDDKLDTAPPPEPSPDTSTRIAGPQAVAAAIATAAAAAPVEEEDHAEGRRLVIGKRAGGDAAEEELRGFNPRPPNFLPLEPDPEAEKVDLRHQMMEDRKNSEEWMIDYALRRAVDKLAPGRKRKVALLVEAFEAVAPVPAYGSSLGHSGVGFAPIQACS